MIGAVVADVMASLTTSNGIMERGMVGFLAAVCHPVRCRETKASVKLTKSKKKFSLLEIMVCILSFLLLYKATKKV